jgi:hypothetical protein
MAEVKKTNMNVDSLQKLLEIVYSGLKTKALASDLAATDALVAEIQEAAKTHLTDDDVLTSFDGYNADDDAEKVVNAGAVKAIVDKVNGIDSDKLVLTDNVIDTLDDVDEDAALQIVAASVIKALSDELTELKDSIGQAGGIAALNDSGLIDAANLPSFVDDVVEGYLVTSEDGTRTFYSDADHTQEITPEGGKIYIDVTDEKGASFRWGGTKYVKISADEYVEITADEVQTMWDEIVAADTTTENADEQA